MRGAVGVNAILYLAMAICGYLSMTDRTPGLIISRPRLASAKNDLPMTVALGAMSFTLVISTLLNHVPSRSELLMVFGKPRQAGTKMHVFLTVLLVFGTAIVAFAIPNVIAALGLIGGIASVSFSITFPCNFLDLQLS